MTFHFCGSISFPRFEHVFRPFRYEKLQFLVIQLVQSVLRYHFTLRRKRCIEDEAFVSVKVNTPLNSIHVSEASAYMRVAHSLGEDDVPVRGIL